MAWKILILSFLKIFAGRAPLKNHLNNYDVIMSQNKMIGETKSLKRALMLKLQMSIDLGWLISRRGTDRSRLKFRLSVKHVATCPLQLIGPRTKRKNGTKFKRCWVVTQVKKTAWIRGLLVRVPIIYGVPVSTQLSNTLIRWNYK